MTAELQPSRSTSEVMDSNLNEKLRMATSEQYDNKHPYFKFPEKYLGNQIKSYGGNISYTVRYQGEGELIMFVPDIILIVREQQFTNNN